MKRVTLALIVFYTEDGRFLMQDREGVSKRGEEWGFFGGHIEAGESPKQAIIRETKEELDFDLKDHKLFRTYEWKEPYSKSITVYISPLADKMSKFKVHEGAGMKLFTVDEALKLKLVPRDCDIIRDLREILENEI